MTATTARQYDNGAWHPCPPLKAPWDVRWCCEHDWQPHRHQDGSTSFCDWDCMRCGAQTEAATSPASAWRIRRWSRRTAHTVRPRAQAARGVGMTPSRSMTVEVSARDLPEFKRMVAFVRDVQAHAAEHDDGALRQKLHQLGDDLEALRAEHGSETVTFDHHTPQQYARVDLDYLASAREKYRVLIGQLERGERTSQDMLHPAYKLGEFLNTATFGAFSASDATARRTESEL